MPLEVVQVGHLVDEDVSPPGQGDQVLVHGGVAGERDGSVGPVEPVGQRRNRPAVRHGHRGYPDHPVVEDDGRLRDVDLAGADKLARGRRWLLRFAGYDLDIEAAGKNAGTRGGDGEAVAPRYQELLYESNRFDLSPGVSVEVASPEDLEHYFYVRRTGVAPEFRVIRNIPARGEQPDDAPADLGAPRFDADGDISAARVKPQERGGESDTEAGPGH